MSYGANAYAKVARVALPPREAEAAVLLKAAGKLQALGPEVGIGSALNEALVFNQKVWTILATSATDPANQLPEDVKQGVANLAVFVFRQMIETMADPAPEKLTPIITINLNLAAGLAGR